MTRPETETRQQDAEARAEASRHVARADESFAHQLKRLVAEREARRALKPGLYR